MKRFSIILVLALAGLWAGFGLGGCNKPAPLAPTRANATATMPGIPTVANGKLRTMQLWVGAKPMTAELAITALQQETGMMFRTNMGPDDGMLFTLPYPQHASFWMMNCDLPLSAAYIAPDGTILEIRDLEPHNTNAVVSASPDIYYVLETPQGWFKKNGILPGTAVSTEKGSLQAVFRK